MSKAQSIVLQGDQLLLVHQTKDGLSGWSLSGGAIDSGETAANAALREECGITGRILRQASRYTDPFGGVTVTVLVDMGDQVPSLGRHPEFAPDEQILVDVRWMRLKEISERDRALLRAAGPVGVPPFLEELLRWGLGHHLSRHVMPRVMRRC